MKTLKAIARFHQGVLNNVVLLFKIIISFYYLLFLIGIVSLLAISILGFVIDIMK